MTTRVFVGSIVHSEVREKLTVISDAVIAVKDGVITAIGKREDIDKISDPSEREVVSLGKRQFLCPGFIDLHVHAPQFPNIGLGYDKPLLEWLTKYTFPLEKKYSDDEFAKRVYKSCIATTLGCGTTTACYYATIHTDAALELAKEAARQGQRAIVGKVNMNRNPGSDYVETTQDSIEETLRFIREVNKLNNKLIMPAVTPRFAISCDMPLMMELAKIAKEYDCYIQTHISENKNEIAMVKKLFPECKNYTDVYYKAGLLTKKTILGHGIYLSDEEHKVLLSAGSVLAHCPISNLLLSSGALDCQKIINSGIKVGLGTDVSGGTNPSILETLRSALATSINIAIRQENYKTLTYHEAFYLATMGGADALGMGDILGNFKVGKRFDALLVDMEGDIQAEILPEDGIEELVQKFIYIGDDRNIKQVYVEGRPVKSPS